jgi:hypothetical protein
LAQLLITVISSAWFVASVAAKQASSITCEATPVTVGQSTRISVTLTDASTGEGLKARFHMHYSINGGVTWHELGTGIMGTGSLWTDEDGEFSNRWSPGGHLPHDYLLRAQWEGNETYEGCMVIETLTVSLPSDVPLVLNNVYNLVSDSTHYVVGEIKNTGSENLERVKVAVGYYDAAGNTIGAEVLSIPIDILTPNQISPFIFDRSPAAEVASYEVVVNRFTVTEEEPYVDFECSNHRWNDPQVVGLVKNTGSMNAEFVKVHAFFYDASGKPLGYGSSYISGNILKLGETFPFSVQAKDIVGAPHHYTLIVEGDTTTEQPYVHLQLVNHMGLKSDSSYRVSGEVKNTGSSCVDDIKVISAFYDADGNIIDCTSDSLYDSLIPEQSSEFEVYTYTDIDEIDYYELWAECEENAYWCDVEALWKVFITSNSSYVDDISFDRNVKTISFNVEGYSGVGWCRVAVPKQLLGGPFTVLVDGATVTHTQTENATHNFFSFTYQHSEHTVEIVGTTVIEESSLIYCSVEPASANYGDISIEISGYITPADDETKSVPVTIQYSTDSVTWLDVATVTSSSDASYQYVWSPTLDIGTYYVRAMWGGSTTYTGATSETAILSVTTVSTTISLSVSKTSIIEGDEVTVSGVIQPSEQVPITLTYTMPDGSTLTRTATSSSDGSFSDSFKPTVKGSWSVKASWTGSGSQEGATSSTKSFTVTPAENGDGTENGDGAESGDGTENGEIWETIPFLWIIIIVVVVLVVVVIALAAILLSRRQK